MTRRSLPFSGAAAALLCSGLLAACSTGSHDMKQAPMQTFTNPYVLPEDTGARVSGTYFLRRAWVQITRDLSRTEVPPNVPAGLQRRAPLEDFDHAVWHELMRTNVDSVFFVGQAVARHMIGRGRGKIINIWSVQSELGRPNIAPYTASKVAVKMLTKGM
jgi:gluconate 5-dehydrogenase